MFQFIIVSLVIVAISAHYVPSSYQRVVLYQPAHQYESSKLESWNENPKNRWEDAKAANYDFKYEVHDEKTGDIKRQSETATNNVVKGQYSLIDSDGFRRVVDYTADDVHGFQAVVKREPTHYKIPQPTHKAQPISWNKPEANIESWEEKSKNAWEVKEAEKPANYDFKYEVHDEKTGDIKRQSETASNGAVKGQYSLIDSDGFRRVVEYTADDVHGFQATVKREPTHIKIPQPAPKQEEHHTHWW